MRVSMSSCQSRAHILDTAMLFHLRNYLCFQVDHLGGADICGERSECLVFPCQYLHQRRRMRVRRLRSADRPGQKRRRRGAGFLISVEPELPNSVEPDYQSRRLIRHCSTEMPLNVGLIYLSVQRSQIRRHAQEMPLACARPCHTGQERRRLEAPSRSRNVSQERLQGAEAKKGLVKKAGESLKQPGRSPCRLVCHSMQPQRPRGKHMRTVVFVLVLCK